MGAKNRGKKSKSPKSSKTKNSKKKKGDKSSEGGKSSAGPTAKKSTAGKPVHTSTQPAHESPPEKPVAGQPAAPPATSSSLSPPEQPQSHSSAPIVAEASVSDPGPKAFVSGSVPSVPVGARSVPFVFQPSDDTPASPTDVIYLNGVANPAAWGDQEISREMDRCFPGISPRCVGSSLDNGGIMLRKIKLKRDVDFFATMDWSVKKGKSRPFGGVTKVRKAELMSPEVQVRCVRLVVEAGSRAEWVQSRLEREGLGDCKVKEVGEPFASGRLRALRVIMPTEDHVAKIVQESVFLGCRKVYGEPWKIHQFSKICIRCLLPNHGRLRCTGVARCVRCGSLDHTKRCPSRFPRCANCSELHPATSVYCPMKIDLARSAARRTGLPLPRYAMVFGSTRQNEFPSQQGNAWQERSGAAAPQVNPPSPPSRPLKQPPVSRVQPKSALSPPSDLRILQATTSQHPPPNRAIPDEVKTIVETQLRPVFSVLSAVLKALESLLDPGADHESDSEDERMESEDGEVRANPKDKPTSKQLEARRMVGVARKVLDAATKKGQNG